MAADVMQLDARRQGLRVVMKHQALGIEPAHHLQNVGFLVRMAQCIVQHVPPGGVSHLAILQMIPRLGEGFVIADMVVMHVADHDILDAHRIDADGF